jgi:hypothetical protein
MWGGGMCVVLAVGFGRYDVISASSTAPCLVRFRTADFGGRVMLHCHEPVHSDGGTMGWVNVLGGPAPDTAFVDAGECPCIPVAGACDLFSECGSTAGVDSCGNDCTATQAGACGDGQECNVVDGVCQDACEPEPGSCVLVSECGSRAGLDSCGGECTAAAEGTCADGEQCSDAGNVCEETPCVPDGSCSLAHECGSAAGVDSCGNPCEAAAAGTCTFGAQCNADTHQCECTGCTRSFRCGSSAGVDSCGKPCITAVPGVCTGGQQCTSQHLCVCAGCTPTLECGSVAGVDSCGFACTAAEPGVCDAKHQCNAEHACELLPADAPAASEKLPPPTPSPKGALRR